MVKNDFLFKVTPFSNPIWNRSSFTAGKKLTMLACCVNLPGETRPEETCF